MKAYGAMIDKILDSIYDVLPDDFIDSFKESLISTSTGLGDIIAGFIFYSKLSSLLSITPLVLLVYPGILSVRGVITGVLSGNLSTRLNIGSIKPSFRKIEWEFKMLIYAVFSMVFFGAFSVTLLTLVSALAANLAIEEVFPLFIVTVFATMYISFLIVSPITILVAFISYKRGLDPDKIVYPIMSSTADIITTLVFVNVVEAVFGEFSTLHYVILVFLCVIIALQFVIIYTQREEEDYTSQLKEDIISLFMVAIIASMTGFVLDMISKFIEDRKEIYAVYPAVMTTIGDVGSIVGSVGTTRLNMGYSKPGIAFIKSNIGVMLGSWLASLIMFTLYGFYSAFISTRGFISSLTNVLPILVLANTIAVPIIFLISLIAATETYKRGLNPDNFVNPLVSTLSDFISTFALLLAILIFV